MRHFLPRDGHALMLTGLSALTIAASCWAVPKAMTVDVDWWDPRLHAIERVQGNYRWGPTIGECGLLMPEWPGERARSKFPDGKEVVVVAKLRQWTLVRAPGGAELFLENPQYCNPRERKWMQQAVERRAEYAADEAAQKTGALRIAALPKLPVETPRDR